MVAMFEDRVDAADKLCPKLKKYSKTKNCLIVGLTRGGIITAKTISECLGIPLKPLIVKKIGAPENDELAIGAIVSSESVYWNNSLCKSLNIGRVEKKKLVKIKNKEVKSLQKLLKIKINPLDFNKKTVILVDDGVATGASVIAASIFLKKRSVKKITLATPIIAFDTSRYIKKYFDSIVFLKKSADFFAVGQFYRNFEQVSNEEVITILKK